MKLVQYSVMIILIIVLVIITVKYKNKITTSIIGVLILLLVSYALFYSINPSFNYWVNKTFNESEVHWVTEDNKSINVPLPDDTVLDYRFSETGARYLTTKTFVKIVEYYESLDGVTEINNNDSEKLLEFRYNDTDFKIEFVENDEINYMKIDKK